MGVCVLLCMYTSVFIHECLTSASEEFIVSQEYITLGSAGSILCSFIIIDIVSGFNDYNCTRSAIVIRYGFGSDTASHTSLQLVALLSLSLSLSLFFSVPPSPLLSLLPPSLPLSLPISFLPPFLHHCVPLTLHPSLPLSLSFSPTHFLIHFCFFFNIISRVSSASDVRHFTNHWTHRVSDLLQLVDCLNVRLMIVRGNVPLVLSDTLTHRLKGQLCILTVCDVSVCVCVCVHAYTAFM